MTMDSRTEPRSATASISELAGCSGLELVARLADSSAALQWQKRSLSPCYRRRARSGSWPPPRRAFCNLTNTFHGGWIMTMLDTAVSLAAQTTLSPGETCPSHETTAKFVGPISVDTGVMHVIGHVISRGRTVITLEGRIEDAKGKLHAHGTSTCLIVSRKP